MYIHYVRTLIILKAEGASNQIEKIPEIFTMDVLISSSIDLRTTIKISQFDLFRCQAWWWKMT